MNENTTEEKIESVPLNMVPLDELSLSMLAEVDQAERDAAQHMAGQRTGILRAFMKVQRLEGIWGLSEDRRSIVRKQ